MGANAEWASRSRQMLDELGIIMINLIGSPGAGKTTLLERTIERLCGRLRVAVLEGDIETTCDAERLNALGIPVSQLLTGGGCHLEAKMIHRALCDLPLSGLDMVIVENVGNLVCPAEFDIGELAKIAVLSVTEGEDKPLKYPLLFHEARAVVITKTDLLPHIPYHLPLCLDNLKRVNGAIPVFQVSAVTGTGLEAWIEWLKGLSA
ncbi:MAG: hydrogenase accessory protein HypB [Syntrophus sp. (in: bacteria)]|nr:hydrogenase accessory protein HypB [Syntrophus sp. (in: bacteria)]